MISAMLGIVLVFSPDPTIPCDGFRACASGNTVYLRGSPPSTQAFSLNPDLVMFPHFSSSDIRMWRNCGEEIANQAGIEVDYNQLATLCHEGKHTVMGRSHNQ